MLYVKNKQKKACNAPTSFNIDLINDGSGMEETSLKRKASCMAQILQGFV